MRFLAVLAIVSTVAAGSTWTYWRIKYRPKRIEKMERALGLFWEDHDD